MDWNMAYSIPGAVRVAAEDLQSALDCADADRALLHVTNEETSAGGAAASKAGLTRMAMPAARGWKSRVSRERWRQGRSPGRMKIR